MKAFWPLLAVVHGANIDTVMRRGEATRRPWSAVSLEALRVEVTSKGELQHLEDLSKSFFFLRSLRELYDPSLKCIERSQDSGIEGRAVCFALSLYFKVCWRHVMPLVSRRSCHSSL